MKLGHAITTLEAALSAVNRQLKIMAVAGVPVANEYGRNQKRELEAALELLRSVQEGRASVVLKTQTITEEPATPTNLAYENLNYPTTFGVDLRELLDKELGYPKSVQEKPKTEEQKPETWRDRPPML